MTEKTRMSLEEALNSTLDEMGDDFDPTITPDNSRKEEPAADVEAEAEPDAVESEAAEGEAGEDAEPDDKAEDEGDDKPDEPDDADDAPPAVELSEDEQRQTARWSREHKELYGKLDADARALMMDRFKDADQRVTKAATEAAELRRQQGELEQIFTPLDAALKQNGTTRAQYTKQVFDYAQLIARNPKVGIAALMRAEKVSIEDLDRSISQGEVDKEVGAFQRDIASRQAYDRGRQEAAAASTTERIITDFASAKDDAGNLKHPHFEALKPVMSQLLKAGVAQDLAAAYEQASWQSPEIRQQQIDAAAQARAEQARIATEKAEAEKRKAERAKADRAKRAAGATRRSTAPVKTGQSGRTDLDSIIAESMAELDLG